jgi:hypothetical protein
MKGLITIILIALTGCHYTSDPDDDLRTVPVTNNPNVVPNHGGGLPIGGGGRQGPY